MTAISPWRKAAARKCSTQVKKLAPSDRPIKDTGAAISSCRSAATNVVHPVAMRHGRDEPMPARRSSVKPHPIGLRPSFINEHEMFRVQTGLARTPFLTVLSDVRAILLGGAQ